ncbi:hypothetical protein SUGI_1143400 [Cryptomeria japonica]|nr:hypothetical protein SUGI_1143400 [Cryptomeria japonica]
MSKGCTQGCTRSLPFKLPPAQRFRNSEELSWTGCGKGSVTFNKIYSVRISPFSTTSFGLSLLIRIQLVNKKSDRAVCSLEITMNGYFHLGSKWREVGLQLDFMTVRIAEFVISINNSEWTEFTARTMDEFFYGEIRIVDSKMYSL